MKTLKTLLSLLIFSISFELSAQSDPTFSDFLKLFTWKEIEPEYQIKYLKIKGPFSAQRLQSEKRIAKRIVKKTDEYIIVSVKYTCGAGGTCGDVTFYSFTAAGDLISSMVYSQSYSDCVFSKDVDPILLEDDLIITKFTNWNASECDDDAIETTEETVLFYEIATNGAINLINEQVIDQRRQFLKVSNQLLSKDQVSKYDSEELATMRNELFASYGYRFKSEKWSSYFGSLEWYVPTKDEISENELSHIERRNLMLIKEAENKK